VCAVLTNLTLNIDCARAETFNVADAISPLIRLLSFNDIRVRKPAASVLMNLTSHSLPSAIANAIPSLERLLDSDDIQIQDLARTVLANIPAHHDTDVAIKTQTIPFPTRLFRRISQWPIAMLKPKPGTPT
jgi:hypothetical protein